MRYRAVAVDYDGTLATHGGVPDEVLPVLLRLKGSGRRLVLVTGRRLEHLERAFGHCDVFDRIVAENGGLLAGPGSSKRRALAKRPPRELIAALKQRKVTPLDIGQVVLGSH